MSRVIVGVVSDLHCGSTVGLHPDTPTVLDDGGRYLPSAAQGWLWHGWQKYIRELVDIACGDPIHLILNGDLVDGAHHGTTQVVSNHPNVQVDIAKRCIKPLLGATAPHSVVVVRGTEVHVGPSGSAEESLAKWIRGAGHKTSIEPGTTNLSNWHFRGSYEGVVIDATHHGRVGGRPWTKSNGTASLAAEITMEHAIRRETPPDIALRSHYHQHVDTHDAFPVRVIQTPAWQLGTAYVKRRHAESLADVGGLAIEIEDGQVERVHNILFRPERHPTQRMS